jgi:hypothetical protein
MFSQYIQNKATGLAWRLVACQARLNFEKFDLAYLSS